MSMLRHTESRVLFFASMMLASLLLVVLGNWAIPGILGSLMVGIAILPNAATVLYAPFIPKNFYGNEFLFLFIAIGVLSFVFGCIAFGF